MHSRPYDDRIRVSIVKTENQVDLMKYAAEFVASGAEVLTDNHRSYNLQDALVDSQMQVRHKVAFMDEDGTHTNNVECFFGELRRAQTGAFHGMGLG
jgi:ISXO2-like transposase domain